MIKWRVYDEYTTNIKQPQDNNKSNNRVTRWFCTFSAGNWNR